MKHNHTFIAKNNHVSRTNHSLKSSNLANQPQNYKSSCGTFTVSLTLYSIAPFLCYNYDTKMSSFELNINPNHVKDQHLMLKNQFKNNLNTISSYKSESSLKNIFTSDKNKDKIIYRSKNSDQQGNIF